MLPNPDALPGVVLAAERGLNVFEAVVAAVGSLQFEAHVANGQRELVDHDHEVFERNLFFFEPVPHGLTAQVHERAGLDQHDAPPLEAELGAVAEPRNEKGRLLGRSPGVQ